MEHLELRGKWAYRITLKPKRGGRAVKLIVQPDTARLMPRVGDEAIVEDQATFKDQTYVVAKIERTRIIAVIPRGRNRMPAANRG